MKPKEIEKLRNDLTKYFYTYFANQFSHQFSVQSLIDDMDARITKGKETK